MNVDRAWIVPSQDMGEFSFRVSLSMHCGITLTFHAYPSDLPTDPDAAEYQAYPDVEPLCSYLYKKLRKEKRLMGRDEMELNIDATC